MLKKNIGLMIVFLCGVTFGLNAHAVKKNITPPDDQPKITQWLSLRVQARVQRQEQERQKAEDLKKAQQRKAAERYWQVYDYQIKTDLHKG
ncbi:MAG: hypothetical protein K2P93_07350 [Alphaproteobacteria bacterium]|nr:hypothetical protein [Alphaproteobacteria bacterium]